MMAGIVMGAAGELRPIQLRTWAGSLEREKGAGPWALLEDCMGFWDVRRARDEFKSWAREGK
jgi:hypothetical protein